MLKNKNQEKGSVFTVLLAGVALAAMLSVVLYQVISGPMASLVRVSNKTAAKNQLQSVGSIAIMDAINQTSGGDCDEDGNIEPRVWRDKGTSDAPTGGGLVPNTIGAPLNDPWGSEYGYCVWDIGIHNDPAVDNGCGANVNRLMGTPDPSTGDAKSQTVLAIISAGSDKKFSTECRDYVDGTTAVLVVGGDDTVQQYTYNEASTAMSSLWKLKPTNSDVAEIDKNITVGNPVTNDTLSDTSGVIRALAVITEGLIQAGGAIRLSDETRVTSCAEGNIGDMRYNADTLTLEVCDGAGTWAEAGGGAKIDDIEEGSIPFANADGDLIEDDGTPPALSFDTLNDNLRVGKKISFVTTTGAQAPIGIMPNAFTLDYMDDAEINGPVDDQTIVYNGTTSLWTNQAQRWGKNGTNIYYNSGNVGIGTNTPASRLGVTGGISVGSTYASTNSAPANSLIVEGTIGIGTITSASKLDVEGGISVGVSYSGTTASPTNGLIVEGNVGIGMTAPTAKLEVNGRIKDQTGFVAPVGSMIMFGGTTAPEGWLLCNGASVSTTTYAELFAAIGYTYGGSGGSFNLPDMRGAVPRGAGTSVGYAQNVTRALGTKQDDALQGHEHDLQNNILYRPPSISNAYDIGKDNEDTGYSSYNTIGIVAGSYGTPRVDYETRMKNVGVNFIIKY